MAPPLAAIAVDNGSALMLIILIVLPIAGVAFARSGSRWREIGKGPFSIERAESRAEQEAEIRQMIEAKSYLRSRRGEAPLDVEAETERQIADFIGLGK
jgi:hypothetical protein